MNRSGMRNIICRARRNFGMVTYELLLNGILTRQGFYAHDNFGLAGLAATDIPDRNFR